MVASDVVLGHFALVFDLPFSEEIRGVALLQERITFIFFVREDATKRSLRPLFLPTGCGVFFVG